MDVAGMTDSLIWPSEIQSMTPDEALATLEFAYRHEVDRRLRAVGLHPVETSECGHPYGLERDLLRNLFRCERCGWAVTSELLARMHQAYLDLPSPSDDLRYAGRMITAGLTASFHGASPESRAAVQAKIQGMAGW